MPNVLLIDDEPLARRVVREYLKDFPELVVCGECGDGFDGLKSIRQLRPDLVFLDVQMPKINGFEMLELLEQPPPVIFTTAFDEYAMRAFEAHAVDYLLKPFSQERFARAVQKWQTQQPGQAVKVAEMLGQSPASPVQAERIVVRIDGKIKIIPLEEVHFLEAADDYVNIVTAEGSFPKNKTMSDFEKSLPAHLFVRCHRSYTVQVRLITRIEPYEKDNYTVSLSTGERVPVSRSGYIRLKEVLGL